MNYKIPISVLVIIYNNFGNILLLKRADSPKNLDLWQSVTGSKENSDANLIVTACREIYEETKFFATEHQIENLNLRTMSQLIYFFMVSAAFSALLFEVDPFNQPGVEAYKKKLLIDLGVEYE